jgi:hypothetical protein
VTLNSKFQSDQTELSDYARNIESTFADRRVSSILCEAREAMKEALHNVADAEATTTMDDKARDSPMFKNYS